MVVLAAGDSGAISPLSQLAAASEDRRVCLLSAPGHVRTEPQTQTEVRGIVRDTSACRVEKTALHS